MATRANLARVDLETRALPRPSPFIKWVGGKGRLLGQLLPLLPPGADRMRHVEPFAGGAAMFFARRPERALLCDVNAELVHTYRMVRDEVDAVIGHLAPLSARHDRAHYYRVRERYNATRTRARGPERAAMFIYLNKTCFNGLHRVNRKGEFNVPAGRYKNPRILHEDLLRSVSAQLARAEIAHEPFEHLLEKARPGDFVYLDPPYEPVSRTSNFTSYATGGFGQDDQTRLRDVFDELTRRGCKCMLSNSDVPFIRELYRKHRIDTVAAPRAVNCDARRRGLVSEVVVRNY
ncbi:MAG TPA: DNA adenine methylase [Sandaracinaceae bacterium LLY-WYZ-13_1]|nr:DNA adenine methylase [Sandaracinaceae bacterium LLY-WYZ-13_1]